MGGAALREVVAGNAMPETISSGFFSLEEQYKTFTAGMHTNKNQDGT